MISEEMRAEAIELSITACEKYARILFCKLRTCKLIINISF